MRPALVWLSGTVVASALILPIAAPSLLTVVAGLPNDHYHAFLDPVVAILVGLVVAPSAGSTPNGRPSIHPTEGTRSGWAIPAPIALGGYVVLLALALGRQPAMTDPDGGWPAARASGARVASIAAGRTVFAAGVPSFKTPELALFPAAFAGATVDPAFSTAADPPGDPARAWPEPPGRSVLVVPCDRIFESYLGVACGGPAEDARAAAVARASGVPPPVLVDRFDISARETLSVYRTP